MIYVGVGIKKLVHMLYVCDMVRDFGDEIISFMNELYCISLNKCPTLCMLGINHSKSKMSDLKNIIVQSGHGCRITVRQWKMTSPSSFKNWIELMINMVSYERYISRLSGHQDLFMKTWSPFLNYIKNGQCPRSDLTHQIKLISVNKACC